MENARSASQDRSSAVSQLVGETDPGLEILLGYLHEAVYLGKYLMRLIRNIFQTRYQAIRFGWIGDRFPSQAQIQGQPWRKLKIILCVEGNEALAITPVSMANGTWLSRVPRRQNVI